VKLESKDEKTHLLSLPNVLAIVSVNSASVAKPLNIKYPYFKNILNIKYSSQTSNLI